MSIWAHLPPALRSAVHRRAVAGLEFILSQEAEREVVEGWYHRGMAAVVQVLARKPAH